MNHKTRPQQTALPDPLCGPGDAWRAESVPEGGELRGYLASWPWGFLTHYSKTRYSQPCAKMITKGALPCHLCKNLPVKWRAYTGIVLDKTWDRCIIVGGSRLAASARDIPLWSPVRLWRGKGKTCPTRIERMGTGEREMWGVFDLIARKDQSDLWPDLLRLWGDRELAAHFGYTLSNSQGTVTDTESGTPHRAEFAEDEPVTADETVADILKGMRFVDPPRSESNGTRHRR